MPTHTTTSFTGDPMESALNDTHDMALARILVLQARVQDLKEQNESQGRSATTLARCVRDGAETERDLRAQIDVAVAAHHAALRSNEALRKDRDDACERASRLSKQLVEADLEIKRLENARGLWKQRADRLIQQRKTVFGQRMRRIQHALGLPYDSSLKDIAEHVERLADVGLNYREAEGDLSKVRDELTKAREQIREAAKNVAQSADLEYQRKEQGRLSRELSEAGAELHEARRKFEVLKDAVRSLYYAAHWEPDRATAIPPSDMWKRVRDAGEFPMAQSPKPLDNEAATDRMVEAHGQGQESTARHVAKALGFEFKGFESFFETVAEFSEERCGAPKDRQEWWERLHALVDGYGAHIPNVRAAVRYALGLPRKPNDPPVIRIDPETREAVDNGALVTADYINALRYVQGHTHQDARGLVRAADARATRAAELRLGAEAQAAHFLAQREALESKVRPLLEFLFTNTDNPEGKAQRGTWIGWKNIANAKTGSRLFDLAKAVAEPLGLY